jgi:predicted Zn-dependent protease with MMP-like domain
MELEPPGIIPPDEEVSPDPDPVVVRVEDALDDGRYEEALELAEAALAEEPDEPASPVGADTGRSRRLDLLFLAGDALLGMGRAADAEARFRDVLAVDPACAGSRCWLAMALYRQCRFDEAEREAKAAVEMPDAVVDAHVVNGLLLERRGRYSEADACFRRAAEIEPDKYQVPIRMSRAEFDREVKKAAKRLPRQFRMHLERVPVIVQEIPDEALLQTDDGVNDPDLLGLFHGISLPETGELGPAPTTPNYIYLFQRNLERFAKDRDDLVEQIKITLYHELGHYLGYEEDDLDDIGLA